jgi:hypothetical protein
LDAYGPEGCSMGMKAATLHALAAKEAAKVQEKE